MSEEIMTMETKTATMEQLDTKSFGALGVKVMDDEKGIAEVWVSTTGIVDHGKDLIQPGAYADTIKTRAPKGAYAHDTKQLISKALEYEEVQPGDDRLPQKVRDLGPEAGAVRVLAQYNLATQKGREAWEELKFFGDEAEFSIGYATKAGDTTYDQKTGVRTIGRLDWFEWSQVPFGMAPGTGVGSMKSLDAKAFAGSLEERRDLVVTAIRELLQLGDKPNSYAYPYATFVDRMVVEVWDGEETTYWQVPYIISGDDTVTLGDPVEVEIEQSIVEKANARVFQEKVGRVLSSANIDRLRDVQTTIGELLDAAGVVDDTAEEKGDGRLGTITQDGEEIGYVNADGEIVMTGKTAVEAPPVGETEVPPAAAEEPAEGEEEQETSEGDELVPVDLADLVRQQSDTERALLD